MDVAGDVDGRDVSRLTPRALAWRMALLCVAYVLTARAGLALGTLGGVATAVWPPSGLALAAVTLWGRRVWPAIALGAVASVAPASGSLIVSLMMAFGNVIEAIVGAAVLRSIAGRTPTMTRRLDVVAIVVAAFASTPIAATIGTTGAWLSGAIKSHDLGLTWVTWCAGDVTGDLVVGALLLAFANREPVAWGRANAVEAVALAVVTFASAAAVFVSAPDESEAMLPRFMMFPALLWAALRFGPRVALSANLVVAITAIGASYEGRGLYWDRTGAYGLLALLRFLAVSTLTALTVAAVACEVRQARAQLEASLAALRRSVDLRQRVLSIVSHDLRNPLTTLGLTLDMLDAAKERPDVLDAHVKRMRGAVGRMRALVDDLVDVTRIEIGKLAMTMRPDRADLVVHAAIEQLAPIAAARSIVLTAKADAGIPVACDRTRLIQVLSNLVDNALKATPSGGSVTVCVTARPEGVEFTVADTGAGLSPEGVKRVFEPFWQQHEGGQGLGLGLPIARGIVEAHGGTISVESREGHGTTFRIVLPHPVALTVPDSS